MLDWPTKILFTLSEFFREYNTRTVSWFDYSLYYMMSLRILLPEMLGLGTPAC